MDAGKLMLNAAICFSGLRALASLNTWSLFGQQLDAALALFHSSFHQHNCRRAAKQTVACRQCRAAAAACGQRIRGENPGKLSAHSKVEETSKN